MRIRTLTLLAACLLPCLPLPAQSKGGVGDLMIMPTRVVLEGRERAAEVALRNVGSRRATYRILFKEMDMAPSGKLEERTKRAGELTASDLIRYSPRQVDLEPGETQTVRLQVRKPEGLPDGEYRSHLLFQAVPPPQPPKPTDAEPGDAISFDIKTIFGISIPVIVRHGEVRAAASLSDLRFEAPSGPEAPPALSLDLRRDGNRSIAGEFQVRWEPASGRPVVVLPVAGGVVYHNLPSRRMRLDLPGAKGLSLRNGRLRVTFTPKDFKQAPVVATLDLP